LLNEPQPQASPFDSTEMDEWAELDGISLHFQINCG
jgi:hypothetical protein